MNLRDEGVKRGYIDRSTLKDYLEQKFGMPLNIEEIRSLGSMAEDEDVLKQFGFGKPIFVCFRTDEGEKKVVFHRIRENAFGREREDDRVSAIWLDYQTFNELPRHVPALDMLIRVEEGNLRSIGNAVEMLLLTGHRSGQTYAQDLVRIGQQRKLEALDLGRAGALAGYLADIHQKELDCEGLWIRRLRDLIGHGEGVMGLTDNYPSYVSFTDEEELRFIEEQVNRWRWNLKPLSHRLRQVHGDFHPYNVLFEEGLKFHVLDRSRGAWGEPADDVSCMSINYLFFSLQHYGRLDGPFQDLHERFWETYFDRRMDEEMLTVIQPWLAWRALVLASPVWYPDLEDGVRRKLIDFARNVLANRRYDFRQINQYLVA
jgi:hypothetical protein